MTSGQFYCLLWALFLRQNGFYCLMDTVDLGQEPLLDIVLLKENNPLRTHKTLISWPLSFYGCGHLRWLPCPLGHRGAQGLELPVTAIPGNFQLRLESIKGFQALWIFSSVFSLTVDAEQQSGVLITAICWQFILRNSYIATQDLYLCYNLNYRS